MQPQVRIFSLNEAWSRLNCNRQCCLLRVSVAKNCYKVIVFHQYLVQTTCSTCNDRMRTDGLTLVKGRFRLDTRKTFSTARAVRYHHMLPGEIVDSSSLEMFKDVG